MVSIPISFYLIQLISSWPGFLVVPNALRLNPILVFYIDYKHEHVMGHVQVVVATSIEKLLNLKFPKF